MGNEENYKTYYDMQTQTEVTKEQTYHVGTADLAWYLQSANGVVSPGASGKLEFYIIPKVKNLKNVTVKLNVAAYGKANNNGTIEETNDEALKRLIKGHILLFQNLDDQKGYSNWLTPADDGKYTFTVSAANSKAFTQNVPYKVTVYWIWPKYFRNYIYTQKSTQEDLFGNSPDKPTYDKLLAYVNNQRTLTSSTLFYKAGNEPNITGDINNSMDDTLLSTCSQYYDDADEYIGTKAGYLYVRAEAEGATSNG